jgi:hypothetical protein
MQNGFNTTVCGSKHVSPSISLQIQARNPACSKTFLGVGWQKSEAHTCLCPPSRNTLHKHGDSSLVPSTHSLRREGTAAGGESLRLPPPPAQNQCCPRGWPSGMFRRRDTPLTKRLLSACVLLSLPNFNGLFPTVRYLQAQNLFYRMLGTYE